MYVCIYIYKESRGFKESAGRDLHISTRKIACEGFPERHRSERTGSAEKLGKPLA